MRNRLALMAAFAAVQLAYAAPALAQHRPATSASVELRGYTLTDLAPDDGIAPSVVFYSSARDGRATIETADDAVHDIVVLDRVEVDPLTQRATAGVPGAGASVNIAGKRITTSTWRDAAVETSAWGNYVDTFVLSPHTRLTLDFTAQVSPDVPAVDLARSMVIIRAGHRDIDWNELGRFDWGLDSLDPGSASPLAPVNLESGDTESLGYVDFYADSHAWAIPAAPVPEPGAWAMLAAGLALAAPLQRRRKGRAGAPQA